MNRQPIVRITLRQKARRHTVNPHLIINVIHMHKRQFSASLVTHQPKTLVNAVTINRRQPPTQITLFTSETLFGLAVRKTLGVNTGRTLIKVSHTCKSYYNQSLLSTRLSTFTT